MLAAEAQYFGFPAHPPVNFSMFSLIGLARAIELVASLLLLAGLCSRTVFDVDIARRAQTGQNAVEHASRDNGVLPAFAESGLRRQSKQEFETQMRGG
jgi:hypothetical protein